MSKRVITLAVALFLGTGFAGGFFEMNEARAEQNDAIEDVATLGGGCFWCLDAVYRELEGVTAVESGYSNGHDPDPDYKEVCTGNTGHAEVVQVTFDPRRISYEQLLVVFFTVHDPTTLNRQGADVGTQYRSGVYTHSIEQAETAQRLIDELTQEKVFDRPIVTEIEPVSNYHRAEEYHQNYYNKNPAQGYCRAVINPKLSKFRQKFDELRR